MAQAIICDDPACGQPADWLVTNVESGDVTAYCAPHYFMFSADLVDAARAMIEAQQAEAAADAAADEAHDEDEAAGE